MVLRRLLLLGTLLCLSNQPLNCYAQSESSKALNDQGCEAVVRHDYPEAQRLFSEAYKAAAKVQDSRRMHTALVNLQELYAGQGLTREAAQLSKITENGGSGQGQPVFSQRWAPGANQQYSHFGTRHSTPFLPWQEDSALPQFDRESTFHSFNRIGLRESKPTSSFLPMPASGESSPSYSSWSRSSKYGQTLYGIDYGPGKVTGATHVDRNELNEEVVDRIVTDRTGSTLHTRNEFNEPVTVRIHP